MGMLMTRGRCPKCGGNLCLEKDYTGWYEQCLQCGHVKDLAVVYQNKFIMNKVEKKDDHPQK